MSYVTDHNCPATRLLINLRNARDIAKTAKDLAHAGVKMDDDAMIAIQSLVDTAHASLSEAVQMLKDNRPDLD